MLKDTEDENSWAQNDIKEEMEFWHAQQESKNKEKKKAKFLELCQWVKI